MNFGKKKTARSGGKSHESMLRLAPPLVGVLEINTHNHVRSSIHEGAFRVNRTIDTALFLSILSFRLYKFTGFTRFTGDRQMSNSTLRKVTLPNGEVVEVSDTPQPWWEEHNATGYVDPKFLVPDKKQPRRFIDKDRLAETQKSISTVGVRQKLTVTPIRKTPWATADNDSYPEGFFLVVSGHRRRQCALNEGLKAVPVEIKIYQNEDAHRSDMSILNNNRENLSPLEEAYEIEELMSRGKSPNKVANEWGVAPMTIRKRLMLLGLAPNLQKLLDPQLKPKERLQLAIAEALGHIAVPTADELSKFIEDHEGIEVDEGIGEMSEKECRFFLQDKLLDVIKGKGMGAQRAVEFIDGRVSNFKAAVERRGGRGYKSKKHQPHRRVEVLKNFLSAAKQSSILEWKPEEFVRITANLSTREIDELAQEATEAIGCIEVIRSRLNKLSREKKKRRPNRENTERILEDVPYYNGENTLVTGAIPVTMYISYWEQGRLLWLRDPSKKMPKHLPDLERARKMAESAQAA